MRTPLTVPAKLSGKDVTQWANDSLAVVKHVLAEHVDALTLAERCRIEFRRSLMPQTLDDMTDEYRVMLHDVDKVYNARRALDDPLRMKPQRVISQKEAAVMLSFLFGAFGKRRFDETTIARLQACIDVFDPLNNMIGAATRLWKPVPTHPLVVALAVNQLRAEKIFDPKEAEFRAALHSVHGRLKSMANALDNWLTDARQRDRMVYTLDHEAWRNGYSDVRSTVPLVMGIRCIDVSQQEALDQIWRDKPDLQKLLAPATQLTDRSDEEDA
jgi:hypothetical protein